VNVVVDRDTLFHRGMAIPNVLFAPTINRIGMTKEAFFETVLVHMSYFKLSAKSFNL
jgi:hypothetical protein